MPAPALLAQLVEHLHGKDVLAALLGSAALMLVGVSESRPETGCA